MENRKTTRRGNTLIVMGITAVMVAALSLSVFFTPVSASPSFDTPLCGNGSAPDYGFTYALLQPHWTVDWQNYASEQTVTEVDTVLDRLNGDSIAQTMILIKPQAQVGNRVDCAVHFLRYMQLGLATGERKDNGFVFLIVVEPNAIDVHYGVGLGLPALTASDLTNLNRAAEDSYQTTHSLDSALLALVHGFDTVARSKYAPLISQTPSPKAINQTQVPSGSQGILSILGQLCMGILLLGFLFWVLLQRFRMGNSYNSFGSGSGGMGGIFGGRGEGGGGGGGGPTMRGGGGSGRSGRGN
jgi:hypothetical protein